MPGDRTPHMLKRPGSNSRLTLLDCGVCGSLGHFTITRITHRGRRTFACAPCLEREATANG